MDFCRCLDDMMGMLEITNARLGNEVNVDAALISKWRTGNKLPAMRGNYLERLCVIFLRQTTAKARTSRLASYLSTTLKQECPEDELDVYLLKLLALCYENSHRRHTLHDKQRRLAQLNQDIELMINLPNLKKEAEGALGKAEGCQVTV